MPLIGLEQSARSSLHSDRSAAVNAGRTEGPMPTTPTVPCEMSRRCAGDGSRYATVSELDE